MASPRPSPRWRALTTPARLLPPVAGLLAALLLLPNLGSPLLWEDEAETALVAEAIFHQGLPGPLPWTSSDPQTLHGVTQQGGRDFTRLDLPGLGERWVWAWHPWPQHYLTAASFALLGRSTAAARLPFALLGVLSVMLFARWRLERIGPTAAPDSVSWRAAAPAAVATAIYLVSGALVPLMARQCRYYSLLLLGGLLAVWTYQRLEGSPSDPRPSLRVLAAGTPLGLALALTFYANPLTGLTFAAGLAAHGGWQAWRRRGIHPGWPGRLFPLGGSLLLFALLALPWLLLVAGSEVAAPRRSLAEMGFLLLSQLWRFQLVMVPLVLWPTLAWMGWRARRQPPGPAAEPIPRADTPGEIRLLAVLALALVVLIPSQAPLGTVRYLLPLWPLSAAVLAGLCQQLAARRRGAVPGPVLASIFLVLILGTNLLGALPALPVALTAPEGPGPGRAVDPKASLRAKVAAQGELRSPLLGFLRWDLLQLGRPPGPVEQQIEALTALGAPPRAVLAGYSWDSLAFYLRVPVAPADGHGRARAKLGLPPLPWSSVDAVLPRADWPDPAAYLPFDPSRDPAWEPLALGGRDAPYEHFPDPDLHAFEPLERPPLRGWVRRSSGGP